MNTKNGGQCLTAALSNAPLEIQENERRVTSIFQGALCDILLTKELLELSRISNINTPIFTPQSSSISPDHKRSSHPIFTPPFLTQATRKSNIRLQHSRYTLISSHLIHRPTYFLPAIAMSSINNSHDDHGQGPDARLRWERRLLELDDDFEDPDAHSDHEDEQDDTVDANIEDHDEDHHDEPQEPEEDPS
jgi:hypothetical protein